jgi:hypothetical protein
MYEKKHKKRGEIQYTWILNNWEYTTDNKKDSNRVIIILLLPVIKWWIDKSDNRSGLKGEEFIEIKKKIAFCTINNTHVSICIKSCKIIVINNYLMHINIYNNQSKIF